MTEDEKEKLSGILLDRGRLSLVEYRKLLITILMAGIGLYFVILTKAPLKTTLSSIQVCLVLMALLCMGVGALFGFLAWKFDSRRYFFRGESLQKKNADHSEALVTRAKRYEELSVITDRVLEVFFVLSILLSLGYLASGFL